jgi:SsrA-binding protein
MAERAVEKKVVVRNRKARHDFEIIATYEAGLVLLGSEVKSLKESHASISEAFAEFRKGELWLIGAKIDPYPWANQFNHEPTRPRKLLLRKPELRRIGKEIDGGATCVALEAYVWKGKLKLELAVARGRKVYEKREAKKKQEARREIDAAMMRRNKSGG